MQLLDWKKIRNDYCGNPFPGNAEYSTLNIDDDHSSVEAVSIFDSDSEDGSTVSILSLKVHNKKKPWKPFKKFAYKCGWIFLISFFLISCGQLFLQIYQISQIEYQDEAPSNYIPTNITITKVEDVEPEKKRNLRTAPDIIDGISKFLPSRPKVDFKKTEDDAFSPSVKFCKEKTDPEYSKYIFDVLSLRLDPDPPQGGKLLTIYAKANATKSVGLGPNGKIEPVVDLRVTILGGALTIYHEVVSICSDPRVNIKCPLKPGIIELTRSAKITIPYLPRGVYVKAEGKMGDQDLFCFTLSM